MNQAPAHRRSDGRPLRVVQWATGAVGRSVIRGVLDRPGLELAGVRVFSPPRTASTPAVLAGRDPIGVTATTDTAEILDLDADCVVHAPGSSVSRTATSTRSARCWPRARTSSP